MFCRRGEVEGQGAVAGADAGAGTGTGTGTGIGTGEEERIATVSVSAAAASCMSKQSQQHGSQECIDFCEYQYEIEERLSSSCDTFFVSGNNHRTKNKMQEKKEEEMTLVVMADKRDERNARKDETWTSVVKQLQTATKTTTTETTVSSKSDDIVEITSVTGKFSVDFEKWYKRHTEPTSIDLDVKVVEDVDRYLDGEEVSSPCGFLGNDSYGLSIDIDLASDKRIDLNLSCYDSILQDELSSEKLLEESCEKVDDKYIISDSQLYHLDPLTLLADDTVVADEILSSTSDQSTLNVVKIHDQEVAELRAGAVLRKQQSEQRNGDETTCGKSAPQNAVNKLHTDLSVKDKEKDKNEKKRSENKKAEQIDPRLGDIKLQRKATIVQYSGSHSEISMGVVAPMEMNSFNTVIKEQRQERELTRVPDAIMEQLKLKTQVKLEPRIIKKRRKMSERLEKRLDRYANSGKSLICNDRGDAQTEHDVMTVVAISTDKTSNTTQIVINTGTERQVYQGKTSELIEATGNFPRLPKIDNPVTAVWNALGELGITDDSLQPIRVTEHNKVWFCPQGDCNRQFGRLYTLKGHLLAHYGVRPFKCDHDGCTWAFYSDFKLKRHKKTHLKRKDHVCKVEGCNRRFTTVYNLWSHAKLHSRTSRFVCQVPDCDDKFQTKRALEVHMKSHDQRHAPYVCQHESCGKRYYSSNALTSHQRSHSYKEVDVKCLWPGCGKVFDKPCRLKVHTRSHTGCKPYRCTYQDCKWSFPSSSKLKRHQKKHTNERKFICDLSGCGKAFMRSEHLKEHRLIHTEGCYFHCFVCDARFSAKSSLYVHMKKHQIKTRQLTNTNDDVQLNDGLLSTVGVNSQKCVRTKKSQCDLRAKPIESSSRGSMEVIRLKDTCGVTSHNDVEWQPDQAQQELSQIHDLTSVFHTDQLCTTYNRPIETHAYLYTNEASLHKNMLETRVVIVQRSDDEDTLKNDLLLDTNTDYVPCTLPPQPLPQSPSLLSSSSSSSLSVSLSSSSPSPSPSLPSLSKSSSTSPSPSSPPPSLDHHMPKPKLSTTFNNAILPKSNTCETPKMNKQRITREILAVNKSKDHGSARTNLMLSDVLRLKKDDTQINSTMDTRS
ncbi:uncharacterized protein LOC105181388 [Harpegnathos saltator]|uniref:uncharacterized protein LOC105181388 n=1 Tax=Harpegnathos saltator TaxID=610380 RepID=UPI000DBEDFD0|nr:uncharacterized protein LOC105181388 [Harpegnathos saltator]